MKRIKKSQVNVILAAINKYIQKAENNEAEELEENGYPEAAATVTLISSLEERIAELIDNQSVRFCDDIANYESLDEYIKGAFPEFVQSDPIREEILDVLTEYSDDMLRTFTDAYLQDAGLERLEEYTNRTLDSVQQWANDTAQYFSDSTFDQLRKILDDGIEAGKSIDTIAREITQEGIRNTYKQARTIAQTEVLRIHSYAAFETMVQDYEVEQKEWHHTGAHKNKPRPNHVRMSGTTIPKMERFDLHGADGCIYHPMFPRDTCLPASESVNCKCLIRSKKSAPDITLDTEEKKQRQREAIAADNERWEEERKNPPEVDTDGMLEWVKGLSKEEQQDYFGGGYAGKQRWALIESGVIDTDEKFQMLYKTNAKGIRSRKPLNELVDDGIITVPKSALKHSALGDYKPASKQWPSGRLAAGGHSQAALEECDRRGIAYQITDTLDNGVRVGNIPSSKTKMKRNGNGQTWFPEEWTEDDILAAGTYVANTAPLTDDGYIQTARYNDVVIRVLRNKDDIGTVYPYFDQEG
ncbi:phage minor head protein [Parablautia sp. Marseille-Q6255]|uniref:phage minor head protein n=1 Tax=Parablautia sp. Marseille-Q6255 TaxID=3039593 RepID=UPI0024BC96DC|nr:phage minor head protein [Parablautia sp. Marseille-Q6255]